MEIPPRESAIDMMKQARNQKQWDRNSCFGLAFNMKATAIVYTAWVEKSLSGLSKDRPDDFYITNSPNGENMAIKRSKWFARSRLDDSLCVKVDEEIGFELSTALPIHDEESMFQR